MNAKMGVGRAMPRLLALLFLLLLPASALAQARTLRVRPRGGQCTSEAERVPETAPTLRASADPRGRVRLTLAAFPFYCAPEPRFDAQLLQNGTIVLTAREPEAPVARCMCAHSASLVLEFVPPGGHPIEVRFRDEVVVRGQVRVANVRWPGGSPRE